MNKMRISCLALLAAGLAACGGSGNTITSPGSGGGGGGDNGGGGGGPDPAPVTVDLGTGIPPAFQAGQIGVSVTELAAGGSTSLSVSLVTSEGNFFTEETTIIFSSACIAQGLASITSPVTTSTGIATVTYAATGCSGADVITAVATIAGQSRTATGTVTVAPATVGSIQFLSATPDKIGLKGTGGVGIGETSAVVFKVVDSTGGPVANQAVSFSLDTSVGGIALSPETAQSGADGRVQTTVQSGTVATSVRVTATTTVDGQQVGTQSSQLVVTTGLPDQDSFSISRECGNVEAFDVDGVTNPVTVRLSDRFNNPVPDGTAVTFTTSGGQIAGSCATTTTDEESGACTVNWVSSNPRPSNGRAVILAHAIGEESFIDVNGNGFFDDADLFTDLGEPFRDDNENGVWDPGEFFVDFNNDGTWTPGDGLFNGLLCGGPDGSLDTLGRCGSQTTAIGASTVIVMSGSQARIQINDGGALSPATPAVSIGLPAIVSVVVGDLRDQPMPAGTTVSIQTNNGQVVGTSSYVVPCTSFDGPLEFPFLIAADTTPSTGNMIITVETPGGVQSVAFITLTD